MTSHTPILDKYRNPLAEAEEILDAMGDVDDNDDGTVGDITPIELPLGAIDPRVKRMSYSSNNTLHSCPRKYQLYKLHSLKNPYEKEGESITFSYGHVVGQGCQDVLEERTKEDIYMRALMEWKPELLEEDVKAKKSFFGALAAIDKFNYLRNTGFLADYELMEYNGKPAVELGFVIELPEEFLYRGAADAVLRHRTTGQIVVVDFKTTKFREVNAAMYKNSAQAIGYSVVLDHLSPGLSSYTVLYIVFSTTSNEYIELPFDKTLLQRAFWLRNLLYDKHMIELYSHNQDQFPTNGDACYNYFRECEYLGLCGMNTDKLGKPLTQQMLNDMAESDAEYQFRVSFEDLVAAQLEREKI